MSSSDSPKIQVVTSAVKSAIEAYGVSAGGSRNIAGHNDQVRSMEAALAKFHNKDGALVFSSGYVAGSETLDALGKHIPNVVFLSDSENHASMIAGMRNSRARRLIWKHNDMEDLERQLQTLPLSQPKVIAFESVYSMSGNVAPIRDIIRLAKKYGALTFLDEVHGVGLYGPNGGGVSEHLDWDLHYNGNPLGQRTLQDEIDIISGTMGKAFGTYGGFIATSVEIADMVRSFASGFIFTLALPPALMAGGVASVEYVAKSSQERVRLAKNALLVKKLLNDYDIPVTPKRQPHCAYIRRRSREDKESRRGIVGRACDLCYASERSERSTWSGNIEDQPWSNAYKRRTAMRSRKV